MAESEDIERAVELLTNYRKPVTTPVTTPSSKLAGCCSSLLLFLLYIVWDVMVLALILPWLWYWYVVASFPGMPVLHWQASVGLALTVRAFRPSPQYCDLKQSGVISTFVMLVMFSTAYVLHFFM